MILGLFVLNFVFAFISTFLAIKIAYKFRLYDFPNGRKIHKKPIPRIGGIGFLVPILISAILVTDIFEKLTLFTIAIVVVITEGILDDLIDLHYSQKLLFEFFCASFIFLSGYGIKTIGFNIILHPSISFIITIIGFVGVINAFNMLDGLDGELTIISIISFSTFAYFFYISSNYELFKFSVCIIASLFGFLLFNFPNARVFMGDVGALALGFLSASFSVFLVEGEHSLVPPIVPVIILSIPIFDTIWTIIRRIIAKHPIFYSDKRHLHHILYKRFGKIGAILIMTILQLIFSSLAILTYRIDEIYLWFIAMMCFIILGVLGYEKTYNLWLWRSWKANSR